MNNKTILITGGSSDIGIEFIKSISEQNVTVIALYNQNFNQLNNLSENSKVAIIPLRCNLSKESDILKILKYLNEKSIHIDCFLHLAAPKISQMRYKSISWEVFQNDIEIQLKSAHLMLKELLPAMVKKKAGKVVFMLSSCTFNIPPAALCHYTTVKYAMLGFMKSLASEYRSKGININALSPSMIETQFLENINSMTVELSAAANPQKRNATLEDVVPVIDFLLSDKSRFIFGVNIPVSGGEVF
jgi:3-oxoacyl-[acyl-carrier protein] reductase